MAIQGLILPPNYFRKLEDEKEKASLIYLLGPIKGAPNWHEEAIERIRFYSSEVYIACPSTRLNKEFTEGINPLVAKNIEEQNEWENYHRERAQKKGCILFWFAKQTKPTSFPPQFKTYAHSVTMQIGRYSILQRQDKRIKIAVGIEPGYFGDLSLVNTLTKDDPNIKIFSGLEETCKEAAILACK